MHAATLIALEFDRIQHLVADRALTPLGRSMALALAPSGDPATVAARLRLTAEGLDFVKANGSLGLWASDDLAETLAALEVEGQALPPLPLVSLARFLHSVDQAVAGIRRSDHPALIGLVAGATSFEEEVAAVERAIDPSGEVNDHASPALRDIRDRLRRQRARLRATLEGLSKGRDTAKYLQDQIVTDRNGRYVLVVRAEHRESIPGIVHGSSASGASLYLEPMATVELNNETVTLAEKEAAEVQRILQMLTGQFQRRGDELAAAIDAAAEIDLLHAKVDTAIVHDGVAPSLTTDGRLEFRGARHPLLIERLRTQAGGQVVASDLLLLPPHTALVISGPNTGGKTVALKAFGLLAAMAQAGLLIPVEYGSAFTPFASIWADIGDDQSISASLSTFSAHIAHLVEMERHLELPALVLLDEVGGGTDPVEGGALGIAVIDHFRTRGATVVATTHDDTLKSYAATTGGVAAAAFGFVPETYAPTYRLVYGAPGRSLALEIAERLGMPKRVIADARARRSGRERQLAAHLERVDKELAQLEAEKQQTARERATLDAERTGLQQREARLAEREAVLKQRMDDKLNEKLREARAEVDKVVDELKAKARLVSSKAEARAAVSTGEIGELRAEARKALEGIGDAGSTSEALPGDDAPTEVPANGTRVFVTAFGAEGIVRGGSGKHADVEIRGKRLRVALKDLRLGSRDKGQGASFARAAGAQVQGALNPVSMELVLIGQRVDEAMDRLEKLVDEALMRDARVLRVVHGHGTGKLRDAVRRFFDKHPLVASFGPAPDTQGGGGATIVTLRD